MKRIILGSMLAAMLVTTSTPDLSAAAARQRQSCCQKFGSMIGTILKSPVKLVALLAAAVAVVKLAEYATQTPQTDDPFASQQMTDEEVAEFIKSFHRGNFASLTAACKGKDSGSFRSTSYYQERLDEPEIHRRALTKLSYRPAEQTCSFEYTEEGKEDKVFTCEDGTCTPLMDKIVKSPEVITREYIAMHPQENLTLIDMSSGEISTCRGEKDCLKRLYPEEETISSAGTPILKLRVNFNRAR